MANTNPIDDQYWRELWALYDNERGIEVQVKREHRLQQLKMALLAAVLLLFFSVPCIPGALVDVDLGGRLVTTAEALTFEAFRLDPDIFTSSAEYAALTRAESVQMYYWLCQFIYKWIGYAGAMCLVYWLLFIDPYKKLRARKEYREYIQDVVYEDPKNVMAFLKKTMSDNKYRWAGFFYTWCAGCALCMLVEAPQWTWIAHRQFYWFSATPSIVPVALILLLFINVCFALVIGLARPKTRSGSRKKTAAVAAIAACLFGTILVAVLNADSLHDYVTNWNAYSIGYPQDKPIKDYFVNYTMLFWGLGIALSALAAWLFPLCCTTYQNARFRRIIGNAYHAVTERHESAWEHAPLRMKHDKERKLRAFVRRFSAFELTFFFGLTLFALWGLYFYWGQLAGDDTIMYIGIGVMAFEVIWAIALSPVVHYHLEKRTTYQGKRVGWVMSEDRGIGSWKKYWRMWNIHQGFKLKDDEKAELLPVRRLMMVLTGIFALWICGTGINEKAVYEFVADLISVDTLTVNGVFAIAYTIIAPILLVYCVIILKFNNPKDPERGKKRIYAILFEGFLAGLVIGIAELFRVQSGAIVHVLSVADPMEVLITTGTGIGLMAAVLFLLNLGCFPIFVRIDDLYKSIPDLIKIMLFGVILLSVWNLMCEWLFTTPRLHWSWTASLDPVVMRDSFLIGDFLYGVGGYFFWGWVQELLFLGYFCWLLYKIQPNKWINAAMSSLLFMMFHWDNIALMVGTALGGFMWAIWFDQRRNLFMLGWMHGFNGTLVSKLIPMSMTVGPGAHD